MILVVEDDKNVREPLCDYLVDQGYQTEAACTLVEAKEHLSEKTQIILLDWNLPDGEGIDFLKEIRSQGNSIPVIFLTGKSELTDKVLGLELGACDYVTKPFERRELLARIRVNLKKSKTDTAEEAGSVTSNDSEISVHGITVRSDERTVMFSGEEVELAKKEYDLLWFLIQSPGKVFSRAEILDEIWGMDNFQETRAVDNHIFQLRKKFTDDLFETVHGVGYRMKKVAK